MSRNKDVDSFSNAPLSAEEYQHIAGRQITHAMLIERAVRTLHGVVLKPGDQFIDVGARGGFHTEPMAKAVGPKGRGLAVEADPSAAQATAKLLADQQIDWVSFANVAAFERAGAQTFYVRTGKPGWSSLYKAHEPKDAPELEAVETRLETLDVLVKEHNIERCAFMKLDIEHAEIPALRGAGDIMRNYRPIIVFENGPKSAAQHNGYGPEEFFAPFEAADYAVFDYMLKTFTRERWNTPERLPTYYIALPQPDAHAFAEEFGWFATLRARVSAIDKKIAENKKNR